MQIIEEELPGNILKVILDGRLGIEGASSVDLKMNLMAGSRNTVLVDLQRASFLASVDLRSLVIPVRTIRNREGNICAERDG